MIWQPEGCCCFTRRTGSLILASLSVICGIFGMLNLVNIYANHDQNVDSEVKKFCLENLQAEDLVACRNSAKHIVMLGGATLMLLYIIQVIISSLLIHGVSKNDPCLMIPYMVLRLLYVIFAIMIGAGTCIALIVFGELKAMAVIAVVASLYIFLETYFLLVIRAHYLQMRKDSGYDHVELEEECPATLKGDGKKGDY
ncbi:uncharacterized protein LOC122257439 [Penaeus japonicus]|uniref:uncharacterized protein LOC122257439 n=1 Tax=Penaeus japonicus TaxID=27405 RepID=UPI001C70FBCD|nr:uncharacterized protein LOC122257439 [Penaeus japonicus]